MQDNENEIAPLERMSPHCDKAKLFQEATFYDFRHHIYLPTVKR